MATKSKNINPFIKALCVILSAVTFFFTAVSVITILYYGSFYDPKPEDYLSNKTVEYKLTDTYAFNFTAASSVQEMFVQSKNSDEDSYNYYFDDSVKYYFVNRKTKYVNTNLTNEQVKSKAYKEFISKYDCAFQLENGKFAASKLLDDGNFDPLKYISESDRKQFDIYLYYDFNQYSYDGYICCYNFWQMNHSINYFSKTIQAVILLVISLTLMIAAYVMCGKKDRNGKVKRAFIDYVPTDIHFIISSALIGGGVFLICLLFDEIMRYDFIIGNTTNTIDLVSNVICLLCTAIWLLLIELTTSFIRVCKSEKKIYENFLLFMIIKGLIKLDIKIAKKVFEPLTFKPETFKRTLIFLLIAYNVLNFILCGSAAVFAIDGYNSAFSIPAVILIFISDAVLSGFAFDYIKKLDVIIACAHNRTPVPLDYNKLPKSLKVLTDSLRYTNQELDRAVSKAVKDERLRTELITNVSHDLKTPLTSIISYVDLLKGCNIQDETANEYIDVLDEKGKKLKRLIEDLIEASKITNGVITLNPVTLDLNELVTQAIVEQQQEFVNHNLELVLKNETQSILAFADGNKTYRIIENLLSNAKKYSAPGSRVYTDIYEANNTCIFEIKNISAEPLDISPQELTERFVRGDKSRTNEGNGLGLSIAQNLCTAQGGRLELSIDGDLFKAKVILPKGK